MPLTSPEEVRTAVKAVLEAVPELDAIAWGSAPLRISKRIAFPAGAVVVVRERFTDFSSPGEQQQTVEVGVVAAFKAVGYAETGDLRDAMAQAAATALLAPDAQGLNDRTVGISSLAVEYDGIPEDEIAWFDMTVTYEILSVPA
jgi:hypothetical protein